MVQIQIISKVLKSKSPDIIINNDLTSDHFQGYSEHYMFIMEHYKRYGNVPDILTFLEHFENFEIVEVMESDKYLVEKINEEYLYTKLVPVLEKTAELMQGNSADAYDFLKTSLNTVAPINSTYGIDIIADAKSRYEEYINKKNSEVPWSHPTGFKELDDAINGLAKGEEFVVIVARTNQGKSWVLAEILTHNWKFGCNVGYISPEMSPNAIGYRFDSLNEHFSNFNLYSGRDVGNYEDYIETLQENQKYQFRVATPMDFNKIITVSKLRNFCIQNKIEILGIDGITYLTDERYKRGDNKTTSLTNISEDLMALSCELKIPIVTVVQANRTGADVTNGVPELESIRDSDGISYNASKVLSIRQKNSKLLMEVKKNRNGPVGVKLCYDWDIDVGTFEYNSDDFEYSEQEEQTSKYSNKNNTKSVENKQPIRQPVSTKSNPF